MLHALSLTAALALLWVLLSGMFEGLLLAFGVAACGLVVAIALRMDVVDHEGHPIHLRPLAVLRYWLWLIAEIVKSNIDVSRRILHPKLPISPTVLTVPASQHTEFGQVIYANSITLTPGTVSINLSGRGIDVHALTREAAAELARGEMDRRVTDIEGEP